MIGKLYASRIKLLHCFFREHDPPEDQEDDQDLPQDCNNDDQDLPHNQPPGQQPQQDALRQKLCGEYAGRITNHVVATRRETILNKI